MSRPRTGPSRRQVLVVGGGTITTMALPGASAATTFVEELGVAEPILLTWGDNGDGQLGLGDTTTRDEPTQVGQLTGWDAAAAGFEHGLAIRDGELYAWGVNGSGQLGTGDTSARTTPTRIGSATDWSAVAAAVDHSLGIRGGETGEGTLYAWGLNAGGRTGLGTVADETTTPTQIGTATDWTRIVAGPSYSIGVRSGTDTSGGTDQGGTYAWGTSEAGCLGLGATKTATTPTKVSDLQFDVIGAGSDHVIARTSEGKLYAWGANASGQLGDGTTDPSTTPKLISAEGGHDYLVVAAGSGFSLAIRTPGVGDPTPQLWAWGSNDDGRTALGMTTGTTPSPTRVGSADDYQEIACGRAHALATRVGEAGRELYAWGANDSGQLGLGDVTARNAPTRVGGTSTGYTLLTIGQGADWSIAIRDV